MNISYVNQCQTSGNYLILRGIWQILEMNILPLKILTINTMPANSKKIDVLVSTLPILDKTCKSLCRSIYTRTRFCTAVKFQYINEILSG